MDENSMRQSDESARKTKSHNAQTEQTFLMSKNMLKHFTASPCSDGMSCAQPNANCGISIELFSESVV